MNEAIKVRVDERLRKNTLPNLGVKDYWRARLAPHWRALGPHRPGAGVNLRPEEEKLGGLLITIMEAQSEHYDERVAALEARVAALEEALAATVEPAKRSPGRPRKEA